MVWQPYWNYLKPIKIFFSIMAGQIEGKLHANVPQALGIPGYSQIFDRSHGLAAILDYAKIFQKIISLKPLSVVDMNFTIMI